MKKIINNKTAVISCILSLIFEIAVLCLQIANSKPNPILPIAIIFVTAVYLYLLKQIKTTVPLKMYIVSFFLLFITLAQLIYELFPSDIVGVILAVPAVGLALIAIKWFAGNEFNKK